MKIQLKEVSIKPRLYKTRLLKLFSSILDQGSFINGQENQKLIKNLHRFLGRKSIVLTASGHDALLYSLLALNIQSTDEIIFPVNAYPTAFPIILSGAKPVPVDVDENGLIDIDEISNKITNKTKVIVIVHLYGLVVDIKKIKKIVGKRRIYLIEDCAQAFGSKSYGKPVGTFGDISCFSFYPTKNLATLGDGGAIWTKHQELARHLKKAVAYGSSKQFMSEFVSGHSRIPEIQSAVLNLYFKDIKENLARRKKAFETYIKYFRKYSLLNKIRVLYQDNNSDPALHLLVVQTNQRNKLKNYLRKKRIETSIHYPIPIHLLPAFKYLKYKQNDFPKAERLAETILSIPFHSYIKRSEIKYVIETIRNFYYG